jgi:hypothetical protein
MKDGSLSIRGNGIEKGFSSPPGKARTAAKLDIWQGFATPHGGELSPFLQRVNDSGH